MLKQIKHIEEGLRDESEEESDIVAETQNTSNVSMCQIAVKLKVKEVPLKVSKKEVTINKHKNTKHSILKCEKFNKLDGVGPVDNRPSTDQLNHFVRGFLQPDNQIQ